MVFHQQTIFSKTDPALSAVVSTPLNWNLTGRPRCQCVPGWSVIDTLLGTARYRFDIRIRNSSGGLIGKKFRFYRRAGGLPPPPRDDFEDVPFNETGCKSQPFGGGQPGALRTIMNVVSFNCPPNSNFGRLEWAFRDE